MKYLKKLLESTDNNQLKEYDNKRSEFNVFKTKILNLVYEYLNIHQKKFSNKYSYYGSNISDCYMSNKQLCIDVDDDAPDFVLSKEDTDDLIIFMNNPKSYKDIKKYNL